MESTHERLEKIEHTQHAAHDPFNRNVAMTMAIIAAVLACVTLLSHRGHNETLRLQAEGNKLITEANVLQAEASDGWAFYQAKNIRKHEYDAFLALIGAVAKDQDAADKCKKAESYWRSQSTKYEKEDLPDLFGKAKALERQRDEKLEESVEKIEASHHAHARADRFDLAELFVELALVLCSVSVLTKRKDFWLSGIICGVVGACIAAYVQFFMH